MVLQSLFGFRSERAASTLKRPHVFVLILGVFFKIIDVFELLLASVTLERCRCSALVHLLPVFLQLTSRGEGEGALTDSALDLARDRRPVRQNVCLQKIRMVTAQLAQVGVIRMWQSEGERLFLGTLLLHLLQFPLGLGARSQMLLEFCKGGKLFLARLTLFNFISFLDSSESRG